MTFAIRAVAALAGAAVGFKLGGDAGCWVYEATGPGYAQCGYEFEGFGHVITGMFGGALTLGFVTQWLVGVVVRRGNRS